MGLNLSGCRKNGENIAGQVEVTPRKLQGVSQRLAMGPTAGVSGLQAFVGEQFGAPNGVIVLDDTGFAKNGTR